jgi:hypothetical protein
MKILFVPITLLLLLAGCQKAISIDTSQQNGQTPVVTATSISPDATIQQTITPATTTPSSTPLSTITPKDSMDYTQYLNKTWVEKTYATNVSFYLSKIVNGKVTGRFSASEPAIPSNDLGTLNGSVNGDKAECQFDDGKGDKGTLILVFKPNDEIDATVKLAEESEFIEEGTTQFIPYNLHTLKNFSVFKDQSFNVDLNFWGNVNFVSGQFAGKYHILDWFFLTNKEGDILYESEPDVPYGVDVKAVSFKDMNKDGLKDIILIFGEDNEFTLARVFFQKNDGTFANDPKLDKEINDSGNNKDIKTVINYLSNK